MSRARDTAGIIQYNRISFDSNNAVGIGSSIPDTKLDVAGGMRVTGIVTASSFVGAITGTASDASGASGDFSIADKIVHTGDTNTAIRFPAADTFTVETSGSEALRIDSGGRLLLGTGGLSTDQDAAFQVASTSFGVAQIFRTGSAGSSLHLSSTTGTLASPAALADGDHAGYLSYRAYDGAAWRTGANIGAAADGQTWASGDCPTRLVFATTADGGTSPTEALRITSAQKVLINTTSAASSSDSLAPLQVEADTDADAIAIFGRSADDVSEVAFYENDKSTKLGELQYQQSALNFRHRVGHISFAAGGTTEQLRLTTAGLLSIVNDTGKFTAGSSDDLQMYHDGTHSRIVDNRDSGTLRLQADGFKVIDKDAGETMISAVLDGAVELYHDNSVRVATTADGVDFSGTGSIKVPVGTTAERPTGVAGDFRYNSTTGGFEGYTTEWGAIAGGGGGITSAFSSPSGITTHVFLSDAQEHKFTCSGITTISCAGGVEGESHTIRIINSGITTVGFSTFFLFPSGAAPSLPTADGAISLISFTVNRVGAAGTQLLAGASVNFS